MEELVKLMEEEANSPTIIDPTSSKSPKVTVDSLNSQYNETLSEMTASLRSSMNDEANDSMNDLLTSFASNLEEETERVLTEGENKVRPLINKVEEELTNVETAKKELENLMGGGLRKGKDPLTRLLNFQIYPLYLQCCLGLSLLLTIRGASSVIVSILFGSWMAADLEVSKDFGFAIFEFIVGAGFGFYYFYF